jgi:hypothetical protein
MEGPDLRSDNSMCFACGQALEPGVAVAADVAPACLLCGASLAMAPVEDITDETLSVGFIGGGRGARAAIAVADSAGGATLFTENGLVRKVPTRHLRHFTRVRGLSAMSSRLGAALVALEHLPLPALTSSTSTREILVSTFVGGRLDVARRVASDLADAGVSGPISQLPLSVAEIHWWSALADLRVQRFDQAVEHLGELPLGAYAPAVGLLVLCTGAPIAATSRRARGVLEKRLLAVEPTSPLAGAAKVSGRSSPLIEWLSKPEPFDAIAALPVGLASVAVTVLRALAGAGDRAEPVHLPAKAPLCVIDDLIERDFHIADESLRAMDREHLAYITARTDPEALTDEEVDLLDIEHERDRRMLLAGRIPDPSPTRPDSALIASIRRLVAQHKANELLRQAAGPMVDSLAAFLAEPTVEKLEDRITDDESVWGLLERALTEDALAWDPPEGGSARRFLAWWAIRRTQRCLWASDWHGALTCGKHALRLAEFGPAHTEAYNMLACTNWLIGKDQDARQSLLSALQENDDERLKANLGIVNATEAFGARRQPYLILGLPTNADRPTAERAFAQRSRMARRDPEFPHTVDDLIWALNQVESQLDDPGTAPPVFQLPIDHRVVQAPSGPGLFRPLPVRLARRTPPLSAAELGQLIAEARSDALLDVLKGAGYEARRSLGAGRDAPPPRPLSLESYPRQRQTRLPQYLLGVLVVAAGIVAAVVVIGRHKGATVAAPVTTTATTVVPTTVAPTIKPPATTSPPRPGFSDSIIVGGSRITPRDPVTGFGHLCVLFDVTGSGPLGFVPAEVTLHYGARIAKPDLAVTTGRATSEPVFGETGSVSREICWLARDWDKNTTDIVYRLGGVDYRWRIADPQAG